MILKYQPITLFMKKMSLETMTAMTDLDFVIYL